MSKTVQVHVGESIGAAGGRFLDAWKRAENGELTPEKAEFHVSFETWEGLVKVMTPKRLELLRHVHRHPAKNIRALADALGRDYRRVYEDVEALVEAGLMERDSKGVRAEYEAFDVQLRVAL
ncbi:MAG: hypothetical protein P4L71_19400 [Acetobacteraceae bacterium]|nr:hypothetical protein [Acetobacteraceae bacterium]